MDQELASLYGKGTQARSYLPGWGVFEREVRRFFRVPAQTLGAPMGNALVYFTIFHFSLGRLVEESTQGQRALSLGLSYTLFLVPGIMSMEVVNASFQNPMSSIIQSKWTGTIVDQLMAPLDAVSMWLAYVAGAAVRCAIVALSTYVAGTLFAQQVALHNAFLWLLAIVLTAGAIGSIGIITGVVCKTFDQVGMVGSFILQPLIFLSGVFFSLSNLPAEFQWLPYLNPIFYVVNMFRHAIVGVGDIPWTTAFGATAAFMVVLSLCAMSVIRKGTGMRM